MRDRIFWTGLYLLLILSAAVSAQEHQRLIVTPGDAGISPADPLTGRQRNGSFASVAAFADQWRTELGAQNLFLVDWPVREPDPADRIYAALADSTLRERMMLVAGYAVPEDRDSLLARFGIGRGAVDSLGETEWLVADRYAVGGQATVRVKRQDFRSIRPSGEFRRRFAADEQRVQRFFSEPVAELDTTLSTRDGFFGPSAFADLFHRFQLETVRGAEVSFFAPPARDAMLPAGPLALRDVLRLFRFDNRLVRVRLTGEQLLGWMEKVFGMRFFRIEGPQSDLVRLKVPYYLHDDVAGIRFRVDLTARSGHRVTIYETERGERFDAKRTYTVVLNSFRAKDLQALGLTVEPVAEDYRLALARWLLAHDTLRPRMRDNWSAGPERWVELIEKRERQTIFDSN